MKNNAELEPRELVVQILDLVQALERDPECSTSEKMFRCLRGIKGDTQMLLELLSGSTPISTLDSLVLANDWRVGACFVMEVISNSNGRGSFTVIENQPLPSGTVLIFPRKGGSAIRKGDRVRLELKLVRRASGKLDWKLIHLEQSAESFGYRRINTHG